MKRLALVVALLAALPATGRIAAAAVASTRAIVGRATVTLRANRTRNVRVSLSRRARHRALVAEI